jgi:hypothetical protein
MVVGVMAGAAGCGGGGGGSADAGSTASTAPVTTVAVPSTTPASTVPPTALTLRIGDVHLINSEESDSGMRVLLPAGVTTASVTLTGLPSPNQTISVCQAGQLDKRLASAVCRTPANGETVTVALGAAASGVEVVQLGVSGSGPAGNSTALDAVTVRYSASSREINVRLPQIAAGDSGGRPTFSLTPPSGDGSYRATLTWTVIQVFGGTPSAAQLDLLQGGTPTGQTQSGTAEVRLGGTLPTPGGDVSVRLQNTGSAALVAPTLNALLP